MSRSEVLKAGWVGRFLAQPNDSIQKTLFVALALCLVCSILVAGAVVLLKPWQAVNKAADKKRNILEVAGLLEPGKSIDELFQKIETRVVDLRTGDYAEDIDPATFDEREAAKDPARSDAVPPAQDIGHIRRRAHYAAVYLVKGDDGGLKTVILPVHGYGLWSTMYGLLALQGDLKTIAGLKFYQQAETPGLGAEVDNPRWRALWPGKLAFDDQGQPRIEVIKGAVSPGDPDAKYKVDGLAGSTLTSRGVSNLLHYWLSEQGFGPYLARLRTEHKG